MNYRLESVLVGKGGPARMFWNAEHREYHYGTAGDTEQRAAASLAYLLREPVNVHARAGHLGFSVRGYPRCDRVFVGEFGSVSVFDYPVWPDDLREPDPFSNPLPDFEIEYVFLTPVGVGLMIKSKPLGFRTVERLEWSDPRGLQAARWLLTTGGRLTIHADGVIIRRDDTY